MSVDRQAYRDLARARQELGNVVMPEVGIDLIGAHKKPGLRALWTMGSVGHLAASRAIDVSGNGHHLADAGGGANVTFGYDPNRPTVPIAVFGGGANQYLSLADAGANDWADVGTGAGSDLAFVATQRGLSLSGWFWVASLPGAIEYLIAKDDRAAAQQYELRITAINTIVFRVYPGPVTVQSGTAINTGWNHAMGLYDQVNQDTHVVLNGRIFSNVGGAPAALADSGAPFTVGADGAGATRFTGYGSICALYALFMPTDEAQALHEETRAAYGV